MKELPIAMIVVHWPSKLHQKSGTTERDIFGLSLRERIAGLMEAGKSNFIVLGDFNDEPFDSPISQYLMGTRDINLALGNRQLLYNPFWKHLTDPTPFKAGGKSIISVGTQYYRGDPVERWRTFDQILVSTSLLEQDVWCLNEEATGILNPPGLAAAVGSAKERIDHLPVIGEIEKVKIS